jgi:DNA helicase-2/ATP-dependent DNA helicase PcrA
VESLPTCDTLKIHGAPGTGKTFRCSQILKEGLQSGISESEMLYTTYRREAANDAITKIATETGIKPEKLRRVVNTTHGICLSLLLKNGFVKNSVNQSFVFNETVDIPKFNSKYGYNLKSTAHGIDSVTNGTIDSFLNTYSIMRSTGTPINEVYKIGLPLQYAIDDFKQIVNDLEEWKSENGKLEYADMIDIVIKEELLPDSKIQIYDEAQDMTTQMHTVSKMWADNAESVVLAGDHLQTLYPYQGANPKYFVEWDGELEVIPESRRLRACLKIQLYLTIGIGLINLRRESVALNL